MVVGHCEHASVICVASGASGGGGNGGDGDDEVGLDADVEPTQRSASEISRSEREDVKGPWTARCRILSFLVRAANVKVEWSFVVAMPPIGASDAIQEGMLPAPRHSE